MRNRSENQVKLVMIRHGATRWNKEHRYLGRTDEVLTEEGIKELSVYRTQNRYPDVEYVFTSPMKRCIETAQILYPDRHLVMVPEWVEIDFGAFEGKNYLELQDNKQYQAWIDSNGTLPFPEGESREEFAARSDIGFHRMRESLLQRMNEKQEEIKSVAMVVHGGTLMSLLSKYYGGEYFDYQVSNGKGYVCTLKSWKQEPEIVDIVKL